ncbi:hypothetical protein PIB30_101095 [Stylosanthes scabra]|uniref:Uncharacterized protein n=1 Tax=Stylosanthes scabra TaxID=79078 RepID=A0ABU6ZW25_9FABA|nr:hypothetical protein [Stylosanthes scabra]
MAYPYVSCVIDRKRATRASRGRKPCVSRSSRSKVMAAGSGLTLHPPYLEFRPRNSHQIRKVHPSRTLPNVHSSWSLRGNITEIRLSYSRYAILLCFFTIHSTSGR